MGDRRVGDRREKEQGVLKIKFEDAVKYIIIGTILMISIITNIVLAVKYTQYKRNTEELYYEYEEDGIEDINIDELMNSLDNNTSETNETNET